MWGRRKSGSFFHCVFWHLDVGKKVRYVRKSHLWKKRMRMCRSYTKRHFQWALDDRIGWTSGMKEIPVLSLLTNFAIMNGKFSLDITFLLPLGQLPSSGERRRKYLQRESGKRYFEWLNNKIYEWVRGRNTTSSSDWRRMSKYFRWLEHW